MYRENVFHVLLRRSDARCPYCRIDRLYGAVVVPWQSESARVATDADLLVAKHSFRNGGLL